MKRTLIAVMLLGTLANLFIFMPTSTSLIVRKAWTRKTLAIFTGYRLLMAAFAIWMGWL